MILYLNWIKVVKGKNKTHKYTQKGEREDQIYYQMYYDTHTYI